ncbi:hypothetical protein RJT34_23114 [Clitoria ternatea]|uniref:Uncharacterized protein n=1 Tax=Clitoria ternatea TaxID=43366 RepID=A0AAN9FLY0_CLITE
MHRRSLPALNSDRDITSPLEACQEPLLVRAYAPAITPRPQQRQDVTCPPASACYPRLYSPIPIQSLDPSHSGMYLVRSCVPPTGSLPGAAPCPCLCTGDHSPPSTVTGILHPPLEACQEPLLVRAYAPAITPRPQQRQDVTHIIESLHSLQVLGLDNFSYHMGALAMATSVFVVVLPESTHLNTKQLAFGMVVNVYVSTEKFE